MIGIVSLLWPRSVQGFIGWTVTGKRGWEYTEVKLFKPWTPLPGLLPIGWETLTQTGRTPEFELHYPEVYQPKYL